MLIQVRRLDWPMLAESLRDKGESQWSVVGTFNGQVILQLQWRLLVLLNRLAKEQRAKVRFDLAA